MPFPKVGHLLRELHGFPADAAAELRNYSVTTAEEFVGMAHAERAGLARLLRVDETRLDALVRAAAAVITPDKREEILCLDEASYATGQDAPPAGQETF